MRGLHVHASDISKMIAAELARMDDRDSVPADAVVILPKRSGWWATLRHDGRGRIDEARLAAVGEVGARLLSAGVTLAG